MKISAVNSYALNNLHFESKRGREINKPVHRANPVKAIPLAMILAMSPLNAPVVNAQQVQAGFVKYPDDELTGRYFCKNATPDGLAGCIKTYMTRDGEEYAKVLLLKDIPIFVMDNSKDFAEAIKKSTIEIIPEEVHVRKITTHFTKNGTEFTKKYYVTGSGVQYVTDIRDVKTDSLIPNQYKGSPRNVEDETFEVTEDMYKMLIEIANGQFPVSEENTTVFTSPRY